MVNINIAKYHIWDLLWESKLIWQSINLKTNALAVWIVAEDCESWFFEHKALSGTVYCSDKCQIRLKIIKR